MTCTHLLGTLPCDNPNPHKGEGKGCTHSAAWAEQQPRDEETVKPKRGAS